jgi:ligand-binding sensor domain-containing protein
MIMKGLFLFGLNLVLISGYSQSTDFLFDHLTTENGLSNSSVPTVFEDSKGFIWFGTRDGIDRYDGYEFKIFQHEKKNIASLCHNWITTINEDTEGNLWVGTANGLNMYDPKTEKITRMHENPPIQGTFSTDRIYRIKIMPDSTIWICNADGINVYSPIKKKVELLALKTRATNSSTSLSVFDVTDAHDGTYYIASSEDYLIRYNPITHEEQFIDYKIFPGGNFDKQVFIDKQGVLWITDNQSYLHTYDPSSKLSRLIGPADGLNNGNTSGGVIFKNQDVWISTDGGGINIYDKSTGKITQVMNDQKNKYSLSSNGVYKILEDKQGLIWVTTFGGGVNILDPYKWKFKSFRHNVDDNSSISENAVLATFQDSKGRIWVGTDGGGLNLFNPETKSFEHIRRNPAKPNTLSTNVIVCINEDNKGNLLLGTYAGGLMSYNVEADKITTFMPNQGTHPISSPHVWAIFKDNKKRIWLGLLTAGIDLFDPETQTFTNYGTNSNQKLKITGSGNRMYITQDKSDRIWFAGENGGLGIMDEKIGKVSYLSTIPNNDNSISNNDVKCVLFDGVYAWIATNGGGLDKYNMEDNTFRHFSRDNGLPSNSLMGMLQDDHRNLWVSTTKGMFKFNMDNENIVVYDNNDGLQGNEFKYNSQIRLRDGRMLFGGIEGLSIFNPDSVKPNPVIPKIIFTNFTINNKPVILGDKSSPLKEQIDYTGQIILNHSQTVFSISFVALNYTASGKNEYKYKLEGFDEDWIDATQTRTVSYTNLNAGKYTFRVKASNNDGIWNEQGRSLKIKIRPPWWRTWWFYTILVGFILFVIYSYIKIRERQAKHDKMVLERKIKEGEDIISEKIKEVENHQEELRKRDLAEKNIHWHNEGLNKLVDIISKNRGDIHKLTSSLLINLIHYLDANIGAMYLINDDNPDDIHLHMASSYANEKDVQTRFAIGEGLIGTSFLENKVLEFDNIPEDYVKIQSGLGIGKPKYLAIVPINLDETKVGVFEIAAFNRLEPHKIHFIQKLNETFCSILITEKANEKMKEMIERMNSQTEELKSQEEEMRQNLEEMQATQEETARREKALNEKISKNEDLIAAYRKKQKK